MAALYSNENFPKRTVDELRLLGHDVLTSFEAGRANQRVPDGEVLAYATECRRAVLTLNRFDFIRLHLESNGEHAGIVVCTVDVADPAGFARRIDAAIRSAGELERCLVRVVRPSQ